jgi:hypothetical protein
MNSENFSIGPNSFSKQSFANFSAFSQSFAVAVHENSIENIGLEYF